VSFRKRQATDQKTLQDVIDDTIDQMSALDKASEEFETLLLKLERIQKIKSSDKTFQKISPEVWVTVGAGLLTTLLVINAEHVGIITSKAFSFVPKPKL
jgi:hypothetical protein